MKLRNTLAAAGALVAAAQTAQAQPAPPPSEAPRGDPTAVSELVVTALRRSQTLLSAPLAISVVEGPDLISKGVTTTRDLPDVLPNVQNGVAGFAIRGISSGDTTEKGDPSTAFSLDGIYIARPQQQGLSFFDIERVEVLRGPQGTLYGRNATAGAINVISARPVERFEAGGTVELGNYATRRGTAMVNMPLADGVALRLAGSLNQHDGFTRTRDGFAALDTRDDVAGRARLLFSPTQSTTVILSGDYAVVDDTGGAYVPLPRVLRVDDEDDRYQNPGRDGRNSLKAGGFAAEVNTGLGFADLTYLGGWRSSHLETVQPYGDNGPNIRADFKHRQMSHELRLASSGDGALQWVAGLFYLKEETETAPIVSISPALVLLFDLEAETSSKAAFAQATYSLTPSLRLVGGLRYTEDQKERDGTFTPRGGPSQLYDAAVDFQKWNWKVGAEFDLAQGVLLYGNVSTGYKSGGFNDGNPLTQAALYYDPEDLTAYEVGLKGRFFDNRLYLSTAAFLYDYKGLQLSSVPPTGGILTLNAAKATVKGLEAEGYLKVWTGGALDFNLALLDATYDRYLPRGVGGPSYAGVSLDRAPKTSFRVSYTQDFPLRDGKISANVATKYSSDYTVTDFNTPVQYRQDAYWRSDVSLGYFAAGNRWYVQAFGRNLENNNLIGVTSFNSFTLSEPRQYGVRAGVNF